MLAVNYTELRGNLKEYMDKVSDDFETLIVTRKKNKNIVKRGYINYETNKENRSISDTVFMCIHASGSSDLGKKQKKV